MSKTSEKQTSPNEVIPVHCLRFDAQRPVTMAGVDVSSSVTTRSQANRQGHTITYHPRMRHFKIVYRDGAGGERISFVHETQVMSWDPPSAE